MTQSKHAWVQVLSPMQQRNLQILAPETAKEDLRDLCREVSAACRAPRKSPLSPPAKPAQPEAAAAQPAAHAPQESQVRGRRPQQHFPEP